MKHPIQSILEDAGFEVRSYSGRGMYGRTCLGVDLDSGSDIGRMVSEVIAACVDIASEGPSATAVDDVQRDIREWRQDSMGLGIIVYFPRISFTDDEESEDDPEACPGCKCMPGDGRTEGCTHPIGCGFQH